jgi:hypothetical protein
MIASYSDSWVLVQDEPRELRLSRVDIPDTSITERSVIAFQTTNIIMKQIDEKEVSKEPAWLQLVTDLPTPMTTCQIELEVNCRFVEVYADGNYVSTLKGIVSNASAGPPLSFNHQLSQRITCLNLRLKFISIKNTGNNQKVEDPQILSVKKLAVHIVDRKDDPAIRADTAAAALSNATAPADAGNGDFNSAMLLSMMLQKSTQMPKEQSTQPAMTSPSGQGRVGAGAVGGADLMQMKSLLMADMAHLMDVKLAPLYHRLDALTNRVEELVSLKQNTERKAREASRCSSSPAAANTAGNSQQISDDIPISSSKKNVAQSCINVEAATLGYDAGANLAVGKSEYYSNKRREEAGGGIFVNEVEGRVEARVPCPETATDRNQDRGSYNSRGKTSLTERAMSSIHTSSGTMNMDTKRAAESHNSASQEGAAALMQITESSADGSTSGDGALKQDMKDLMRILRANNVTRTPNP